MSWNLHKVHKTVFKPCVFKVHTCVPEILDCIFFSARSSMAVLPASIRPPLPAPAFRQQLQPARKRVALKAHGRRTDDGAAVSMPFACSLLAKDHDADSHQAPQGYNSTFPTILAALMVSLAGLGGMLMIPHPLLCGIAICCGVFSFSLHSRGSRIFLLLHRAFKTEISEYHLCFKPALCAQESRSRCSLLTWRSELCSRGAARAAMRREGT